MTFEKIIHRDYRSQKFKKTLRTIFETAAITILCAAILFIIIKMDDIPW